MKDLKLGDWAYMREPIQRSGKDIWQLREITVDVPFGSNWYKAGKESEDLGKLICRIENLTILDSMDDTAVSKVVFPEEK